MQSPTTRRSVLVVDDDAFFGETVKDFLEDWKVEVALAQTGAEGLANMQHRPADIVLLDQKLPDAWGVDLCRPLLEINEQVKIIFVTAFPSFDNAVKAVRSGAHDYLSKPFELEELALILKQTLRTLALEQVEQVHQYQAVRAGRQNTLLGNSGVAREIRNLVRLAGESTLPVFITGETGTGKGVIAGAIAYHGVRRKAPFVSINCASLPDNLIEAELFGHEKGAFTGAEKARRGLFEMADGGTLFLDEIGELPLHLQSTLLGVLDNQKIKRIGGESFKTVDTRIIAATNVAIEEHCSSGRFRQDLYYRLGVVRIHLPPLRERCEDIGDFCRHFLLQVCPDGCYAIPEQEIARMQAYLWPGNIRELKNIIERSILFREGNSLNPSRLLGAPEGAANGVAAIRSADGEKRVASLKDIEKEHVRRALQAFDGNHTRTAKALGISRTTLVRKRKLYQI